MMESQIYMKIVRLLYYLPMEMWDLMNASLKALLNEQYKLVAELREENKKLKEWNNELIENHKKDIDVLCEENKKLREKLNKAWLEEYWFFNEY